MATLHLALKIGFHFSPISWGKDRISFLMTSFSCDFDELLTASKVLAVHVFFFYDVIMSFTVVVVTFGPFKESLISRRNTDKFCVNLEKNIRELIFSEFNV